MVSHQMRAGESSQTTRAAITDQVFRFISTNKVVVVSGQCRIRRGNDLCGQSVECGTRNKMEAEDKDKAVPRLSLRKRFLLFSKSARASGQQQLQLESL